MFTLHSRQELINPTDKRIFAVAAALAKGYTIEHLNELTRIDAWFLYRLNNIIQFSKLLKTLQPQVCSN